MQQNCRRSRSVKQVQFRERVGDGRSREERIIANETDVIDVYDPNLTLKGMNLIYKKQNRKSGKIKK